MNSSVILIESITLLFICRIGVNIAVALMLGVLYIGAGNEGSRVLDNYNLLFAILMHSSMATMMLTVLTCKYPHFAHAIDVDSNLITFSNSEKQFQ